MRAHVVKNSDGTVSLVSSDDLDAVIEVSRAINNDAAPMGQRYRNAFTHVAHVPQLLIEKIKNEDGVNFFDKNDRAKFMAIMRQKYPVFLTMPGNPIGNRSP